MKKIEMADSSHIRETRSKLGLTQAEFAKRLGVSKSSVEKWERGMHTPRSYLKLALDALDGASGQGGN